MPDETTILSLPLILPAQAQKHVTHNEALAMLDLIVQLSVINRTLTTAPALPAVGDRHIVASGATGAWAGQSGRIALFSETGWQFTAPLLGWQAHVLAEGQTAVFDGAAWTVPSEGPFVASRVGVSATPDAVNRLAVSSPATLLNHDGAGHQVKVNKATTGDTASLLFQTGFSGRAEMGTAGDDDFSVKVSADGSAFNTALSAEAASGQVTLPQPVRLGGQAADPGTPADGTLWLNTTTGEVKVRSAGASVVIAAGSGVADGDKGDITVTGTGSVWSIDAGAVSLDKLADIAADSLIGRTSAGSGSPEVLTATEARGLLNVADGATANASDAALRDRASHTGTQLAATISDFAAAVAATPAVTANTAKVSNATHSGDVTGATALTIANDVVTNAKLANMGASTLKGRVTAGAGDPEDLSVAQVKTLLAYTAADVGAAAAVHTHTASAVTDFAEAVDDRVAALAVAGSNMTITYNDAAGTLTFDATGGGAGTDLTYTAATRVVASSTGADATLPLVTSGDAGLAPASGGGTSNFLRADGTWAAPGGGGGSGDVVGPASATDNALARFDGTTGKLVQTSAVTVDDAGAMTFPVIATPAVPASGNVTLFGRDLAGRALPAVIGPSGLDTLLQPHFGRNKVALWSAVGNATTATVSLGGIYSSTGTATSLSWGTTFWGSVRQLGWHVTTASTSAVAGMRNQASQYTIGGATDNQGGFTAVFVWGPSTGCANATKRAFVGMRPTGTPTDVNPSTLTNMCGMGWDSADTNVQFMYNDGSGTATKIDLGATLPKPMVDLTTVYRLTLFSPPGTVQSVGYEVENLGTGAKAAGVVTTNLPTTTTAITPTVQVSVGGTSSVVGVAISQIYVETDH